MFRRRAATAASAPSRPRLAEGLAPDQIKSFFENGFLVLRSFITDDEVTSVLDACDRAWADRSIYNNLTVSAYTGTERYVETYVRNVGPEARSERSKLNHLYLYDPRVLGLLLSDKIQDRIASLLDGAPLLFNGLNLDIGSEQRLHFDTFYMPPRTPNKMAVVWLALEDIHPDSGPLVYYPKSHLIPPYVFRHGEIWALADEMDAFDRYIAPELASRGLALVPFTARKGDLFIWHAQLYHGGSRIENPARTRKSMVAHYWRAEDYPADWIMEGRPGRYLLKPERMFVAANFSPAG
jgi:hypothetical protein